ncbi:MAG: 30S ribosomal protein S17e [Candidatus Altiarchaeota archaeon]|nr:30S ribosomal protein S17e [Candidatus Altiarchaeota archaeon]
MGRIKQTYLKRIANSLMKEYDSEFSVDFNNNKKKVQEFSDVKSNVIRNKIAGYITRVMKQRSVAVD